MTRLTRRTLLTGAASGALLTSQSYAQDSQSTGVEEVVVTARRVQEKLQDVPIAVSAFTSKDLEEKQITSIDSFGEGVPNVWVQYTGYASAETPVINIRGISGVSNQIATDSPIGIYVDGIYMARTLGLAFDMADLQSFEVLRGPQGTLLGKNTVGGALSLTTKNPSGVLDAHLEVGFGNYDAKRVKASFDLPEIAGFSIRGTVFHREQGFIRKNPVGGTVFTFPQPTGVVTVASGYDDLDQNGGMLAIRYTGIDDLTIDFKADYSESFDGEHAVQHLGFTNGDLTGSNGFLVKAALGLDGATGPYGPLPLVGAGKAQDSVSSWFDIGNNSDKANGYNLTVQYDLYDNLTLKSITGYRWQRVVLAPSDLGGAALTIPGGGTLLQAIANGTNAATKSIVPGGFFANTNFLAPAGTPFCYSICDMAENESTHAISEELQLIGHEDHFDWIAGFFYFDEIAFITDPAPEGAGAIFSSMPTYPGGFLGNAYLLGSGVDSVDNQSWAFYGHSTIHLNDVVDFSAGIRYTYDYRYFVQYDSTTPGALNGNGPFRPLRATSKSFDNVDWDMSISWKFMPDATAYAKVSTGYLSGGTLAAGANGGAFDPIFITSYEVGLKTEWFDHRLRANIDAYHTRQVDSQGNSLCLGIVTAACPVGGPLGSIVTSNPFLHINNNGLEIEALAVPIKGLTLGVNAGFQTAPVTNGLTPGRPTKNIGLNAEYDFPRFDNDMYFALRVDSTWQEGYTTGGLSAANIAASNPGIVANVIRPATWVVNMRGTLFDIPLGPVKGKIAMWVKNLTDEQNLTFSLDPGISVSGTYDLPRTYGADLIFDF